MQFIDMKGFVKRIFALFLMGFSLSSIFSVEYVPHFPKIGIPGTNGPGGSHPVNEDAIYPILVNPALLSLKEKSNFWPGVSAFCGMPFYDVVNTDTQNAASPLVKIIKNIAEKHDCLFYDASVSVPLTFAGIIPFNFGGTVGWGVFNSVYSFAKIPSLTYGEIAAGFDVMGAGAFSYKVVDSTKNKFFVGATLKLFFQAEANYVGINPINVISDFWETPAWINFGLGLDFGLYYKARDKFMLGLFVENAVAPIFSLESKTDTIMQFKTSGGIKTHLSPMNLKLSMGYELPVKWTRGIMSRWRLFLTYENLVTQSADGKGKFKTPFAYKNDLEVRHPLLNLQFGTQMHLYEILSLSIGFREMLFSAGISFDVQPVVFGVAFYGRELSCEIGKNSQANIEVSILFHQ